MCAVHHSKCVNYFKVCCGDITEDKCSEEDPRWTEAEIIDDDKNSVRLAIDMCDKAILGFRYLWKTTPCKYKSCAIYMAGRDVPAPPYLYEEIMIGNGQWHRLM